MRSTVVLLLVGVLFAGGLGFAAHVVAQDTVGTPAVDLDQREPLAPEEARDDDRTESTATETAPRVTTGDRGDDDGRGGDDDNSGPGGGSSGSGSGDDDDSGQGRGRGRGRGGGGDDD